MWIGLPCTLGSVADTVTAFTTCSGGTGRMETTILPEKMPAGTVSIPVIYMGTFLPIVLWRISIPASTSSDSKLKEQPMRKPTRSSRQNFSTSVYSPVHTPFS